MLDGLVGYNFFLNALDSGYMHYSHNNGAEYFGLESHVESLWAVLYKIKTINNAIPLLI